MFGKKVVLDRVDLDIITIIKNNGYCSVEKVWKSMRILTGGEVERRLDSLARKGKVKRVSYNGEDFESIYMVE